MNDLNPSKLLKMARTKAGLTQRELAGRAGKTQSVIARIESGTTSPTVKTLNHLVHAAGFELETGLIVRPVEGSHILGDVSRILELTPEERLEEVKAANKFLNSARHV